MTFYFQSMEIKRKFLTNLTDLIKQCNDESSKAHQILIHIDELKPTKPKAPTVQVGDIYKGMRFMRKLYLYSEVLPLLKKDGNIILENKFGYRIVTDKVRKLEVRRLTNG